VSEVALHDPLRLLVVKVGVYAQVGQVKATGVVGVVEDSSGGGE
jgi:hypothetical protein